MWYGNMKEHIWLCQISCQNVQTHRLLENQTITFIINVIVKVQGTT